MINRRIHEIDGMYACRYGGKVTLLTKEDFNKWRSHLMFDLGGMSGVEFAMITANIMGRKRLSGWSLNKRIGDRWAGRKFCKRLQFIERARLWNREYKLLDEDARDCVYAFLEVYRYHHYSKISIGTSYVVPEATNPVYTKPNEAVTLITVTIHQPRTLMDWILNRFGEVEREVRILWPSIQLVVGQGEDFLLKAGESWYLFDDEDISEMDPETAEEYVEYFENQGES